MYYVFFHNNSCKPTFAHPAREFLARLLPMLGAPAAGTQSRRSESTNSSSSFHMWIYCRGEWTRGYIFILSQKAGALYFVYRVRNSLFCISKKTKKPWPVWISWLEPFSLDQKVSFGSIPGQGTQVGGRLVLPSPLVRAPREATNQCFFLTSMVLFLSPFLFL